MRMGLFHTGLLSQGVDHLAQRITIQRMPILAKEDRCLWVFSILPADQVTPDGFTGRFTQEHHPAFSALCAALDAMFYNQFSDLHVQVTYV